MIPPTSITNDFRGRLTARRDVTLNTDDVSKERAALPTERDVMPLNLDVGGIVEDKIKTFVYYRRCVIIIL